MDKCLLRVQRALKKSGINQDEATDIISAIKKAEGDGKIKNGDDSSNSTLAKEILDKAQIQKKINKLNAIEDDLKIRDLVQFILKEFPDNPKEGLTAIMVGSNFERMGSRNSVKSMV